MGEPYFEENIAVYESLRNEIIATQGTRTNYIISMYSLYVVLFGIGIEFSRVFFAVSCLILITFQAKINRSRYTIVKISTFLRVFFEDERNDMHWETANVSSSTERYFRKKNKQLTGILSGTSSIQLSILSLITYVIYFIRDMSNNQNLITDVLLIIICILSTVIIYFLNEEYKKNKYPEMEKRFNDLKQSMKGKQYEER